jgi:hypothetical protein
MLWLRRLRVLQCDGCKTCYARSATSPILGLQYRTCLIIELSTLVVRTENLDLGTRSLAPPDKIKISSSILAIN